MWWFTQFIQSFTNQLATFQRTWIWNWRKLVSGLACYLASVNSHCNCGCCFAYFSSVEANWSVHHLAGWKQFKKKIQLQHEFALISLPPITAGLNLLFTSLLLPIFYLNGHIWTYRKSKYSPKQQTDYKLLLFIELLTVCPVCRGGFQGGTTTLGSVLASGWRWSLGRQQQDDESGTAFRDPESSRASLLLFPPSGPTTPGSSSRLGLEIFLAATLQSLL